MLSHVMIGTNDLPRAVAFYDELLGMLGNQRMYATERAQAWGTSAPSIGVCLPFDGKPASVGNGMMVGLSAPTRAMVDAVYAKALVLGAKDEGAPGIRGDNPDGFYGAYFRDLDGNKLSVYRMGPA
jgi:catechol 2,3-dioxygenase-like lactoylglutathione lyase family enzyme